MGFPGQTHYTEVTIVFIATEKGMGFLFLFYFFKFVSFFSVNENEPRVFHMLEALSRSYTPSSDFLF